MSKITFPVCCALFCISVSGCISGCISLEYGDSTGPARRELHRKELPGVTVFEWDSTTTPMTGPQIPLDTVIPSGYEGIDFRVIQVHQGVGGAVYNPVDITDDGAFRLINRNTLIIGGNYDTLSNGTAPIGATKSFIHQPGLFDLSEGTFRITLDYRDANGIAPLRVLLNSNTHTFEDSVLGVKSVVSHYQNPVFLKNGIGQTAEPSGQVTQKADWRNNKIVITLTPAERYANYATDRGESGAAMSAEGTKSLKTAFFALISLQGITITGIKIERLEEGL